MPIIDAAQLSSTEIDYLIIGGGTCGLVVAARLSEDPNVVVAVLEAGDYHQGVPEIDTPGLAGRAIGTPKFDWGFLSVPQKHVNGRVTYQPQGKGLGGSSLLNLLTLSRGSRADFDALEKLGNKGWNWDEIVKYTKKSETLVPLTDDALAKTYQAIPDLALHGTNGPLIKSFSPWVSPLHTVVSDSLERLGVQINYEPARGINVGVDGGINAIDPSTGTRTYSTTAYFEPNMTRKNLLVVTGALVSKVVLEKQANEEQRAVGVEFVAGEKPFEVLGVRKEVILSAGSLRTPAVLELSGIGNPKILQSVGITLLIDLPGVGENLQDHTVSVTVVEVDSALDSLDNVLNSEEHKELYKQQKGALASGPGNQYIYLPAYAIESAETVMRWHAAAASTDTKSETVPSLKKQYNIITPWILDPKEAQVEYICYPGHFFTPLSIPTPGKRYFTFVAGLMHPLSRGSVHIASSNPAEKPSWDPNYLAHPVDFELLTAAIRFTLKVCETEPFKGKVVAPVMPSAEVIASGGGALGEYVKETLTAESHILGSASMLPREDGGVVDAALKVYGTTNLRVIDCSIFPLEHSAHIQSAAYAVAEKGADIIKQAA